MSIIHCSRCSLQVASSCENAKYFFGFNGKTLERFKTCRRCRQTKKTYNDKKKSTSSSSTDEYVAKTESSDSSLPQLSDECYYSSEENDTDSSNINDIFFRVQPVSDFISRAELMDALINNRVFVVRGTCKTPADSETT